MAGEIVDNQGRGDVGWSWPPIHPEGRRLGLIAGAIALFFLFVADWEIIGWPMLGLTIFIIAFFRDPARIVPQEEGVVIAPADGLVTLISKVPPPPELQEDDSEWRGMGSAPVTRVSIFMSIFDVHINRAPVAGTVTRIAYVPGKFINADLDKASEDNERQHFMIERGDGTRIGFTQIAGLVARRIVPFVKPRDIVAAGQRVGLIRFGSRVDIYLPEGTDCEVLMGQKAVAGETVIARLGQSRQLEGISL